MHKTKMNIQRFYPEQIKSINTNSYFEVSRIYPLASRSTQLDTKIWPTHTHTHKFEIITRTTNIMAESSQ